jgi:bidirectional [NiFe] hydrogenase diaphorase subunit
MQGMTAPPEKRLKILDATIRKQQNRQDALIAILRKAQELYGFLDLPVLWHIAKALRLPPSRVYGTATFYHLFNLKPLGQHSCVVCLGTACFVKGGQDLVDTATGQCDIKRGETTSDGKVSLLVARCIGACGIAPVVVLDGETVGHVTPDQLTVRLKEWIHG